MNNTRAVIRLDLTSYRNYTVTGISALLSVDFSVGMNPKVFRVRFGIFYASEVRVFAEV